MENPTQGPGQVQPTIYDYRLYDQIWQRVSPELDPYPEVRGAQTAPMSAAPPVPAASSQAPLSEEPCPPMGAVIPPEVEPCCMGAASGRDLAAIESFIEEELAERQCCLTLAHRLRNPAAARLMGRIAGEKQAAAQRLQTAYFLITGRCYTPAVLVEPMRRDCLANILRSCFHQEACSGFHYRQAAENTADVCLQKLLDQLSVEAFARADAVMAFLERILR